jgi:hypothetical protein
MYWGSVQQTSVFGEYATYVAFALFFFSEFVPLVAWFKGLDDEDHDCDSDDEDDELHDDIKSILHNISLEQVEDYAKDMYLRLSRAKGFMHGIAQVMRSDFVRDSTGGVVDLNAGLRALRHYVGCDRAHKQILRRRRGRRVGDASFAESWHSAKSDSTGSDTSDGSPPSSTEGITPGE